MPSALRWDAEPELGEMGLAHLRRKVQRGHFSASSNDRALLSPADLRSLLAADRQDVPLRVLAAHWLLSNRALFHSLSPSSRHATRQAASYLLPANALASASYQLDHFSLIENLSVSSST